MKKLTSWLMLFLLFFAVTAYVAPPCCAASSDDTAAEVYAAAKAQAQDLLSRFSNNKDGLFLPTSEKYAALQAAIPSTDPTSDKELRQVAAELNAMAADFLTMPEAGQTYRLKNFSTEKYVGLNFPTNITALPNGVMANATTDLSDQTTCWVLEEKDGKYCFRNVGTGFYMGHLPSKLSTAFTMAEKDEAGEFDIFANDGDRLGTAAIGLDKPGVENNRFKWHNQGNGEIVRWNSGLPSSWYFEPVANDDLPNVDVSANVKTAYTNTLQICASAFSLDQRADFTALQDAYKANQTFAHLHDIANYVKKAASGLWRIRSCVRNLSIKNKENLPEADWATKTAFLSYAYSGNAGVRCHSNENNMPEAIWSFVMTSNGFYIYNVNSGKYIGKTATSPSQNLKMTDKNNAGIYKLVNTGIERQTAFECTNNGSSNAKTYTLHVDKEGLVNWTSSPIKNSPCSFWISEAEEIEVPLNTVGEAAYATTCLPFAVSGAEGATIYAGSLNAAAGTLHMNEAADGMAAQTPMLLVGEAGVSKATLKIGQGTGQSNGLSGTLMPKTVSDTESYLTLGRDSEGNIGFFHYTGKTIGANKAFINATALTGAPAAIRMIFDNNVTAINGMTTSDDNATNGPIYDLSGRCVAKTVKGGLYIRNGKKFLAR